MAPPSLSTDEALGGEGTYLPKLTCVYRRMGTHLQNPGHLPPPPTLFTGSVGWARLSKEAASLNPTLLFLGTNRTSTAPAYVNASK